MDIRRRRALATAGGAVVALAVVAAVVAQSSGGVFDMSFSGISGGGDSSAGGSYAELGSIGQPFAGSGTAGSYALDGGLLGGGATKYKRVLPFLSKDGVP
jgi:hypothetical protein